VEVTLDPELLEVMGAALTRAIVPPSRPVKAAVSTRELFETFMELLSSDVS
jgi:hypothetical protein